MVRSTEAKTPLGEGKFRHIRVIESEEFSNEKEKQIIKESFLQTLFNDGFYSGILNCGPLPFEYMEVFEREGRWIARLVAEEQ